ncbi:AcrR family transcriptional regulator [Paenibacillus sp. DS2015]|uniref:TetR/AcrR family transcriptional regulator n=1 Tax=Paenibacillus sp. DS2015 TaxID=3373917 RepID=UPI003D1AE109
MSVTKRKILDSAMRFFLDRGYLATSIQNIADDCGVAKGSVYNFFSSKEDLLIEVLMLQQGRMTEQIQNIREDQTLSLREVFIRETECQIEFFLNNNFIMQELKKLTVPDGKIAPFLLRLRANLLKYNRESLIRVFGEEIEPHIWDLVIIYNGIVREFIFLSIFESKSLNTQEMAVFIVQSIEDMASNMQVKDRPPLLQDSDMTEYLQCALQGESISDITRIFELIQRLISTIKELSITNSEKKELQEATLLIQEELKCEHPKLILIRALISFLEKEHGLKDILRQLEKLVVNNLQCPYH